MDVEETIAYLGRNAGSMLVPRYEEDEINSKIPFFHVSKDRSINIFNFERHDNADRLPFLATYLSQNVFPGIPSSVNLEGFYNVELHDTYSYLDKDFTYKNCLVWSKRKKDTDVVLIPDLYQLINYSNKLEKNDAVPWESKKEKVGFFGTTTGSTDPLKNERIKMCLWGLNNKDIADFYITKVAQIDHVVLKSAVPNFNSITHPHVPPEYLHNYRYLLDVPGNTCSWDRVPLILNSKSLLFKMPCDDMCWYYPLLHDKEHYVGCVVADSTNTSTSIRGTYNYYMNNTKEGLRIIEQANSFTKKYLGVSQAIKYLQAMFIESSHLYAK
jgi:hypothetical protein